MGERPNLARVLADARPEQVVSGIAETAEAGMRVRLQEQAVQRAAQQQAAQEAAREASRRQSLASQRSGPRMRM